MPRRDDIHSILIIGSGAIVIGQACEFDYAGAQACKVLRREGYRVILVNSNPATIMTDPEFADATYIEPLTVEILEKIIAREKPDALLPTVGAQTALNLAVELSKRGILEKYGVQLLGAQVHSIELAEDRQLFKAAMREVGLDVPESDTVTSVDDALTLAEKIGYPVLIRPSFTLGGAGAGIAYNADELRERAERGLRASPTHQVLIEQSVLGWKEYELEVMRDAADQFVVICSIENLDAMGVHTGDSITVAPAMTLTDREYQRLRDAAKKILSAVGVATGGSNVQFAVNPRDGKMVVIEMNPRVSRSSALASKATGFPIAKIAALLAVGYTLDEIKNDITRVTPASFEPSIDYVVVKIPRWAFEKFPNADALLGPQMKAVGEVMALGGTFREALQKAVRGLETGDWRLKREVEVGDLRLATADRLFRVVEALRKNWNIAHVASESGYDVWFVEQLRELVETERALAQHSLGSLNAELLRRAKRDGFGDRAIGDLVGASELQVRMKRETENVKSVYQRVDTCAAEFEAHTPYLYSTYCGTFDEAEPTANKKVLILGGGPNRIGQGIEFDYCCVHACYALQELGIESIMLNCNPETVSTDYDTADRLYFEPVTFENVLDVIEHEKPDGVLIQFGGQTPLNLARALESAGVNIFGTSPEAIDIAEDRARFGALLRELDIPAPEHGTARSLAEARRVASQIGYPVMVRPSFVLGGRAMAIVYDDADLAHFIEQAASVATDHPVLIDRYLEDAFEVDVDCVCDGNAVVIGGIMQHIEEAGIHSGDSACVLPPFKISQYHLDILRDYTTRIALKLGVRGLMNAQFAIKDEVVYVLEVNPRASRTVPFVAKATGVPLARIATQIAVGKSLREIGFSEEPRIDGFFVKEVALPFDKFDGTPVRLGPEMRSTGEVMGHASSFGHAFAKAEMAAGMTLPPRGRALLTVNDFDKGAIVKLARDLSRLGWEISATRGTAEWLRRVGLQVETLNKVSEGSPHLLEAIARGEIALIVNTPLGRQAHSDGEEIRRAAVRYRVPLVTTLSAAAAAVGAIRALQMKELRVKSLQEHYRDEEQAK
ncbi:MAG: carbamoyl phosphate synthase large subunit [Chloroflexi bacterium UTCFX4]|nr:MAG: carbamoyl phosphate synthase large subunit [Chloroflexi bacterium UTCFX4]